MLRLGGSGGRILMTADAVGGVWTYALDLARGLAAEGVETVLVLLGPAPDAGQRAAAATVPGLCLVELGLPLDWLAESPAQIAAAAEAVAAIAVRESVDLVQLNSPALAASGHFTVPIIGLCHSCVATWWRAMRGTTPLPADFAWRTALLEHGYAAADALVAPSAAFARDTAETYRLARPPLAIHNGRRPPPMTAEGQAPFVLTAGRLWDEGKDVATLDRAASRLSVPVLAAGPVEGPNGAQVAPANLQLLGRLDETATADLMAQRPVFASTARYEPFGLAVLEAAQAGCALVLADIPSFRELWDGAAAFAPAGDDAAFATAIMQLLSDRERRAACGAAAEERARRYSVEAMTRGMLSIYRQCLRGGTGMRRGEAA